MRKAASQRTRVLFTSLVLMLFFVFSVSIVGAYSIDPAKPVSGDQDSGDFITGNIRIEGTTAIGTIVNSGTDNVKVGLASYLKVDEDIENQSLHDSVVTDLGPGETKETRVSVPCWAQVDLFRVFPERPGQEGGVITSFKGNVRYGQRLISAVHTMDACGVQSTATPSVSPTVTDSPRPTVAPTNPPGNVSGSTSDGRSDGRGCSVNDCSGNVVAQGGVVAGVSTETRSLPVTGTAEFIPVLVLGMMILGMGMGLRQMAYDLEQ